MGWATGSALMSEIITSLKDKIPDDLVRQEIYETLIPAFEGYDCDTLDECKGLDPSFEKLLRSLDTSKKKNIQMMNGGLMKKMTLTTCGKMSNLNSSRSNFGTIFLCGYITTLS
jgi:hypothetical protein